MCAQIYKGGRESVILSNINRKSIHSKDHINGPLVKESYTSATCLNWLYSLHDNYCYARDLQI